MKPCPSRGSIDGGRCWCHHAEVGRGWMVPLSACEECPFGGEGPRFQKGTKPCACREATTGMVPCSCGNPAGLRVYGCSEHGECLLTNADVMNQVKGQRRIRKACDLCKDYSEVESVRLGSSDLLVAMAYCEKDADRALDLLNWCEELSGQQERSLLLISPIQDGEHSDIREAAGRAFSEVVAITTPYQLADESWPRGPNWMFRTALEALRDTDRPCYWLEPDCFPIVPDWLDRIEAEYAACGKPFMGAIVGTGKTALHMTGCGIYPPGALKLLREFTDGAGAWDYTSRDKILPLCHHSRQFFHFWSRDKEAAVNVDSIPPEAVIGHQCKTGAAIRQLRGRRCVPS